jgi:inner membrane protein
MASAFSHAIAAVAIGSVALSVSRPAVRAGVQSWKYWSLAVFCAVIPDADAIGFWMGVPYDSLWGHRGITHSLFFALLLAIAVMYLFYRKEIIFSRPWWLLFLTFFIATASHPFLDAFTTGGKGVAFFAPFYDERYFFPWRVIRVSPISITRFFTGKGIKVLESEFVWVWIPSFILIGISFFIKTYITGKAVTKA